MSLWLVDDFFVRRHKKCLFVVESFFITFNSIRLFVSSFPYSAYNFSLFIDLAGHLIPAGVSIVAAYVLMHRDEKYYSNPSQWNPANFDADKVASRPAGAFVPFGYGPRKCLGE